MDAHSFFRYARKRYEIYLRRNEAGLPRPWTEDPILQSYRFCNVFREDDRTTRWIRGRVTPERYGERLLGAMVIARWFNRIETLKRLCDWPTLPDLLGEWTASQVDGPWSAGLDVWTRQVRERLEDVHPIVTGAYMIKTPGGMSKLEGLLWCFRQILPSATELQKLLEREEVTLARATDLLAQFPYLGRFMAYEVVTDLRWTPLLREAPDIMTWAHAGPGCARGLCRLLDVPLGTYQPNRVEDQRFMLARMQELLHCSQREEFWPQSWPAWEMREVEHTLCEYDKYQRARHGEGTPKQRFEGKQT